MAESANNPTVRATAFVTGSVLGQIVNACAKGPRRQRMIERLGLDAEHPCAFEARVPEDSALALLDDLAEDAAMPVRVARQLREHHSPIFHLGSAAETVADLFDHTVRFSSLIWSSMPIHAELGPETATLACATVPETPGALTLQRYILVEMCVTTQRLFTAVPFLPLRLRFQGSAPPDLAPWQGVAQSLDFGANRGEIVLERAHLDLPLRSPDERLTTWLHGHLERELDAARIPSSAAGQVAQLVRDTLVRGPDRATVARRLGWSERTLGRRLGDEGTTFRQVVDQVRFERAVSLLPDHTIDEVSERLGFSDARSFERAFRRWAGTTPAAWLRRQLDSGA